MKKGKKFFGILFQIIRTATGNDWWRILKFPILIIAIKFVVIIAQLGGLFRQSTSWWAEHIANRALTAEELAATGPNIDIWIESRSALIGILIYIAFGIFNYVHPKWPKSETAAA